jgi:TRAP-type C4-dicarboxylate transport system permease small subunit
LRRPIEIVSLVGATVLLAWLALKSAQLAWSAYRFHDMSDTLVPVPLWIPMGVVPVGLALFALATAVDAVTGLRGGEMRRTEGEKEEALELARGEAARDNGK